MSNWTGFCFDGGVAGQLHEADPVVESTLNGNMSFSFFALCKTAATAGEAWSKTGVKVH